LAKNRYVTGFTAKKMRISLVQYVMKLWRDGCKDTFEFSSYCMCEEMHNYVIIYIWGIGPCKVANLIQGHGGEEKTSRPWFDKSPEPYARKSAKLCYAVSGSVF